MILEISILLYSMAKNSRTKLHFDLSNRINIIFLLSIASLKLLPTPSKHISKVSLNLIKLNGILTMEAIAKDSKHHIFMSNEAFLPSEQK